MEVKGFFIVSVRDVLLNPYVVLGEDTEKFLQVDPNAWYPGQYYIKITDIIEQKLGKINLVRLGRNIVQKRREAIKAAGYKTPLEYFKNIYNRYLQDNRGPGIGKLDVLMAMEGHVIIKNTTPYNCFMTEGIYEEIVNALGGSFVKVKQIKCKKEGYNHCEFDITWRS